MKHLTLEETRLKEEMKQRCLSKGQYIDENAKAKFEMLCHLEDFEVQYWELQQENKELKEELVSTNESITWWNNRFNAVTRDNKQLKDNWNKLKEYIKTEIPEDLFIDTEWFVSILDKMEELEQRNHINE